LRPGGVSLEELLQVTGPLEIMASTDHPGQTSQAAPGMLPQHYAPRTPLILDPPQGRLLPGRWGVLCFQHLPAGQQFSAREILSPCGSLPDAAANFFAALRRLDELGLDGIVAELFPETGLGRALNDRLRRAASGSGG